VADKEYEKRRGAQRKRYSAPRAVRAPSYEGFAKFNERSTAESFHAAVQAAAKKAATEAGNDGVELPAWYEVTRVRILVGNPNVKVYGATITKSDAPPG
jgi:hypothetical protein